jgi:SAM-dependent methyltransferase
MSVDAERWSRAQNWELALWQRAQRRSGWRRLAFPVLRPILAAVKSRHVSGDDWNEWWARQFEDYAFLPTDIGDYVELGCGPYTNTRLILRGRTANRVVCSDPLAREYLDFRGRWLSEAASSGAIEIDTHPIEECRFAPESFDVVVMINVLDHVRDADLCMTTAIRLLRPGGYFIFGQNLANLDVLGDYEWFEEGHPIRVTAEDLEPHLGALRPVLAKHLPPNDPPVHSGMLVFAGRRESPVGDAVASEPE